MAKTKVALNLPAFYQLRTSPQIQSALTQEATAIQRRAGKDFSVSTRAGKATAVARVYPNGAAGMRAEAKHGALSKAVTGWGG